MHIQDPDQKAWIQAHRGYRRHLFDTTAEDKRDILEQLTEAEGFEQFLHVKFPGTKRFGLDGGESAIPALETIIRTAAELRRRRDRDRHAASRPAERAGERHGQALCGDLLRVPGRRRSLDDVLGSGDVKYHLGTSTDRECRTSAGCICR